MSSCPSVARMSGELGDDITKHGFRATLGSWCTETKVDKQVSDFIKSHQPKYLDAAYSRTDMLEERRDVLQRWADFVTQDAEVKTGGV